MSELRYRPEIDGLRAVAVAAVVLYHADPALLGGGFVGVDIFFVISGYLITALLAAELGRTGRIDFAAFYARRARRLLPALVVLVFAVMAIAALLLGRQPELLQQTGASAVASLLFVANLYFQFNTGGYFNEPVDGVLLLHLWSLAVEEQFYLVYPLLLAALWRWVPDGMPRRIAALSLASLLLAEYWVHLHAERAFYQMPARFWELAAGSLVALSSTTVPVRRTDRWLVPMGLAMIVAACAMTSRAEAFPALRALPAVLGATAVLLGVHRQAVQGFAAALLRSPPLVGLGLVSYSLYLWHWPLLAIDVNLHFDPTPRSGRLLLCVLALVLAWLSWRFVERPFRRGNPPPVRRTLVAVLAVTPLSLAAVLALAQVDKVPPEARRMAERARHDQPRDMMACHFADNHQVVELMPPACRSKPGMAPSVVFWGDSHARAWQPFAWLVADAQGQSAAGVTMNACVPGAGLESSPAPPAQANCVHLNQMVARHMDAGGVSTVIVAMRWPMSPRPGDPPLRGFASLLASLEAAVANLGRVPTVLVMGPLPMLRHGAPTCLSTGRESECVMTRAHYEEQTREVWRGLERIARRHANVRLVDASDYFCDDRVCPVARDGVGLYWDSNHITATAARRFAERYLADRARYTMPAADADDVAKPESP